MGHDAPDVSFNWDNANVSHLARHRITPAEIEEVFRSDPSIRDHEVVDGEHRWTAVGATKSARILVVVFTLRKECIRPITGWQANRQTAEEYLSQ